MLSDRLIALKNRWISSPECPVGHMVGYMRQQGQLRDAQIEAIEIYLFLKIVGENKPLWQLFSEGFFLKNEDDLDELNINHLARQHLKQNIAALALFEFSLEKVNGKMRAPDMVKRILDAPKEIDYHAVIQKIFYGVTYADYLFSLPMGAGKTFLMAAMIYLDLRFAEDDPENPHYAHNFLVLIPSGLKSSITDSLRDIAEFDGSWIMPKEEADEIKKKLRFTVLDVPKNGSKSNRTENPNAAKVKNTLPHPYGEIFVVNAEKLILDTRDKGKLFKMDDIPNELRCAFAEIPNLTLFMDEAHHATDGEIRLRQVVNWWADENGYGGNIVNLLSFTGTPYLSKSEKIDLMDEVTFRGKTISNTVYYYPLATAIRRFLKRPRIKTASLIGDTGGENVTRREIIERAVEDFESLYGKKKYADGSIAKCAIYCSSIETLETEVYPILRELKIPEKAILKYHQGNKDYKLPAENAAAFRALDTPQSRHRYILLVQIGKEGWNCKSLTAVVLSGEGDSKKNMVLQTCCRCLREVDGGDNTALIWLNNGNARILNDQLGEEQQTSIRDINAIGGRDGDAQPVPRHSRLEMLGLPQVDFYQLRIRYTNITMEESPNTAKKLKKIIDKIQDYRLTVEITEGDIKDLSQQRLISNSRTGECVPFHRWLVMLRKNSFGFTRMADLAVHEDLLQKIYKKITEKNMLNRRFDIARLNNDIALAFSIKRTLNSEMEPVKQQASMLIEQKLAPVADTPALYPDREGSEQIIQADADPAFAADFDQAHKDHLKKLVEEGDMDKLREASRGNLRSAVHHKDRSFHYVPYKFSQSRFEKTLLEKALTLQVEHQFEIYYNGDRSVTDFAIDCYKKESKRYSYVGKYTPDFLLIQRKRQGKKSAIHKVLILETKGGVFANDPDFIARKGFVTGDFIKANNEKFGYKKFDFVLVKDDVKMEASLALISDSINAFFSEDPHAD